MGKEQPATYYDQTYTGATEYLKHYALSRYYGLWQHVESYLLNEQPVLDIGCGPGQLGQMLTDNAYPYHGVDFSETAINQAKRICTAGTFEVADVFKVDYNKYHGWQILCCETLEHLNDDLRLLEMISEALPGANCVITVPSFGDTAHVRYFKTVEEVMERYSPIIKRAGCTKIGAWFVLHGIL